MAIYQVDTFDDIVDAIRDELKIQSGDATSVNRIKRNVNMVYLQRVVPFKRWPWLSTSFDLSIPAYQSTGTVSATQDSTTITFTSGPAASVAGFWFSINGSSKRYRISTHTAAATTAVLEVAFTDETATAQAFKLWKDTVALASTVSETVEVTLDDCPDPLESVGLQEFRRRVNQNPKLEGVPQVYHTQLESDGTRTIHFWPAIQNKKQTLHVDAISVVSPLENDSDEPLIPPSYRHILVYGGLMASWVRERSESTAILNEQLFKETLAKMAGKNEDSTEHPRLAPSRQYLATKRRKRGRREPM